MGRSRAPNLIKIENTIMQDFTLTGNTGNPSLNFAARRAALMTIEERWETGFDEAYFNQGSRVTLGDYKEYLDGWFCGWSAYSKLKQSGEEALEKWEGNKIAYTMGQLYKVPYQKALKKRFHLHVRDIEEIEAKRKDRSLTWQLDLALGALNVLVHEEDMNFTLAVIEVTKQYPQIDPAKLMEAYDDQVTVKNGETLEFMSYHELSPQAQAESDLINTLLSNIV